MILFSRPSYFYGQDDFFTLLIDVLLRDFFLNLGEMEENTMQLNVNIELYSDINLGKLAEFDMPGWCVVCTV